MAQTIGMRIPDTSAVAGNFIEIPVYVDSSLSGQNVYSYLIQLNYNTNHLRADSVLTSGTIAGAFGSATVNYGNTGTISIAGAGASPLAGSGVFLILRFEILTEWGSWISFTGEQNNYFNEGNPAMNYDDGYVSIAPAPGITIYPNSGLLLTGEQLQFTVSGDTASPFLWTVENEAVASIDENGLLTAIGPGLTKVSVTDSNNLFDESNNFIEVRGYELSIPGDLSQWQGGTIDIPVYTTDLTGLNIFSGNFSLTYNQNILNPTEVITSGTLLDGISTPEVNFINGSANIAFASSSVLTGEGILLYVRCNVSSENTGASSISFSDVLFNENLLALTTNGYFTTINFANISISPNTANLIAGESLQFTANYGVLPYTWDTDNHEVATIDNNGLLQTIRSGVVHILVQDSVGANKTSGNIIVIDTEVFIPDTTGPVNAIFDLPVFINDLPAGQSVSSIEANFSFRAPELEFIELITTGSLTNSWTYAQTTNANSFQIAVAGTNSFNTAGILFYLRFRLTADLTLNENAWINIEEMLLNEGTPSAITHNGSITGTKSEDLGVSSINSPVTTCGLTANETINISISNYGYVTYNAGDTILVEYQLDNNTPVVDTLFLSSDFPPSTSKDFTFNTTIDLSVLGSYSLKAYTGLSDELDGNPSNNSFTSIIENIDKLPIDLGSDISSCQGDTVLLDAGEGFASYQWSNAGSNSHLLELTTSGEYFVTVTNNAGCQGFDSIIVNFYQNPIVTLGNDTAYCEGYSFELNAGADYYSYNWNNGLSSNQMLAIDTAGLYFVEVTNEFGCTGISDTISISLFASPDIDLGQDTSFCNGTEYTVFAGTGFESYSWSNSQTTDSIIVNETGIYTVTVTALNGCTSSDSIIVTVNQPELNLGNDIGLCVGVSYNIEAPLGNYLYNWNDGTTDTHTITVDTTGYYWVTITDSLGCSATDTVFVEFSESIHVNLGTDITACQGDTVNISAGAGFNTYTWSNGGSVTENLKVTQSGTYMVTVTSGATCEGNDTIDVTFNPLPVIDLGTDLSICEGDSVELIAQTGFASYSWNNGLAYNDTIYASLTGNYFVEVTDVNGCSATDSLFLTVTATPETPVTEDISSCEQSVIPDLTAVGDSLYWYSDSNLTQLVGTGNNYASGQTAPGSYTYYAVSRYLTCQSAFMPATLTILENTYSEINELANGSYTAPDGTVYSSTGKYTAIIANTAGCDSIITINLTITDADITEYTGRIWNMIGPNAGAWDLVNDTEMWSANADMAKDMANTTTLADTVNEFIFSAGWEARSSSRFVAVTSDFYNNTTTLNEIEDTYAAGTSNSLVSDVVVGDAFIALLRDSSYALVKIETVELTTSDNLDYISFDYRKGYVHGVPANLDTTIYEAVCDSYTSPSGLVWTSTGTYNDTIPATAGGDSVITVNLTILESTTSEITINSCDSYIAPDEQVYTTSGIYDAVINNAAGCDSTITINLTINSASELYLEASICEGESFNGYTETGVYYDTLQSVSGCDSVIITNLVVNSLYETFIDISICEGDTYFVGGELQTEAGTYYDTLQSFTFCDSVIITELAVNSLPLVNLGNDVSIFQTDTLVLDAGEGFAEYLWNDGSSDQTLTIYGAELDTLSYSYFVRVLDLNSCSNSDTIVVTVKHETGILHTEILDTEIIIYPNPTEGKFTIKIDISNPLDEVIIDVLNMNGAKIMRKEITEVHTNILEDFDLSEAASGLYLIKIITDKGIQTVFVQKQ